MSPAVTVLGHADRPVTIERGATGAVVTKRYAAGAGFPVFADMTALWASPFGGGGRMPEPRSFDLSTGELRMSFVPGEPLGSRGDLGGTTQHLDGVAGLLAALHGSGAVVGRRRPGRRLLRSVQRKAADLDGLGTEVGATFARVAGAAAALVPEREELVSCHGDFSPRNVLVDASALALIDFDRLQMAGRARDVAYLGAWAWTTMLVAGAEPGWELAGAFGDAYERAGGGTHWRSAEQFHRVTALLRIAHGWSALRAEPDLALAVLHEAARQSRPALRTVGGTRP